MNSDNPTKFDSYDKPGMGIAIRIALMTWVVALITLLVFALLTIPQQKEVFFRNLESKANSVAVSLHNVSAGAAVNEDYASVVTACQTLVSGDKDLDFLIVMKNDGFSLIIEQNGWRMEPKVGDGWLPYKRNPTSRIATVPLFGRRVFHYAQPFDHSGIEWGWIHVGLSLTCYDHSVEMLYHNTIILALGCAVLSLLASLVYARRFVQPILRLRHLVRQIAGGDLSVRTDVTRRDELGSLAVSVNVMTQALLRRDHILESVRFAAQKFMQTSQWEDTIGSVLNKIGEAASADRAYIFENIKDDAGRFCMFQRYEWTARGICPHLFSENLEPVIYPDVVFEYWNVLLGNNEIVSSKISQMSVPQRLVLEHQGILSLIVIPVFVEGVWWGSLGLDDCSKGREWTEGEEDSLRAGADMLGATIVRQRMQEALQESKTHLELRVQERTHELEQQVTAKENAMGELAQVQSSLLEVSRAAGMAEVATGVIHNVGNVLNSVNVSCTLIMDQLRESRIGNVATVAGLMADQEDGLDRFLTKDSRGCKIPSYLTSLGAVLQEEHQLILRETETLHSKVDHIKEIVSMQQTYGGVSGVCETITAEQLMEDALKLNTGTLTLNDITVKRSYQPVLPITVDKHKVLQIFLNLINNAKQACTDSDKIDKLITLGIFSSGHERVSMQVTDNGVGILPENMIRIFQHGFTTRKSGHGFGLHSGALAAKELGGSLTVKSEGFGLGTSFTLELPCQPGDRA